VSPTASLDVMAKKSLPLTGIEPGRPFRGSVTILSELSGS